MMGNPEKPYPRKAPPQVGEIVHLPTGTLVSMAQMLDVAGDSRIVYVGETHDNPASHRLELQVLQGLAERHPARLALGMEMFTHSQQPILDEWVAGTLDEKSFLKKSRWFVNWDMDFAYYRDLLNFVRDHSIPLIALNADKKLVDAVQSKLPEQLSVDERAGLPQMDQDDPYLRAMATEILGVSSHAGMYLDGFLRAQILRDETMAESVAAYLKSPAGADKHLLVLAGGNHVTHGVGIPRRAFRRFPASFVLIGGEELNLGADKQDRVMDVNIPVFPMVPFHFLAYLEYESLPESGVRLGVMIESAADGRGLEVKQVVSGSTAERAGVRKGDRLLSFDGDHLSESSDLIYAVKKKQPGQQGTLQIERQGQALTVDVLFQDAGSISTGTR
jgi:uncharacterized iron-regulated protein